MFVDKYARQPRRQPEYELQTFYGQLQHIFSIQFKRGHDDLGLENDSVVILASIKTCVLDDPDTQLEHIDIRFYSAQGAVHVIDITSLQCLVGRVWDRNKWAIVDRSGSLARAVREDEAVDVDVDCNE
jgi:hypothetical protein